jgi:hypothetical protein
VDFTCVAVDSIAAEQANYRSIKLISQTKD